MTPTPEERADHIYDVTVWQYVHTKRDSAYKSIIIEHIAAEIRAAIADATRWIPVSERLPAYGDLIELGWAGLPVARITKFYSIGVCENATHWRLFNPPTKEQTK